MWWHVWFQQLSRKSISCLSVASRTRTDGYRRGLNCLSLFPTTLDVEGSSLHLECYTWCGLDRGPLWSSSRATWRAAMPRGSSVTHGMLDVKLVCAPTTASVPVIHTSAIIDRRSPLPSVAASGLSQAPMTLIIANCSLCQWSLTGI